MPAKIKKGEDKMAADFEGAGPEARFEAYLEDGKFMLQRSKTDGSYIFYPRVINPQNGEADLEWVEASGEGEVYATTATSRRPEQGGDYNIALVTLKEGPCMMARIVGIDPHDVKIGMPVTADIQEVEGTRAVVFQPVKGA